MRVTFGFIEPQDQVEQIDVNGRSHLGSFFSFELQKGCLSLGYQLMVASIGVFSLQTPSQVSFHGF